VTHETTNATLPKAKNPEDLTSPAALALLAEKEEQKPTRGKGKAKKSAAPKAERPVGARTEAKLARTMAKSAAKVAKQE
jgi:DNA topoisomerase-1